MYASSWFLTLFLNEKSLPPDVAMHIIDAFLQEGWVAMFAIYVGLFALHSDELVALDDDEAMLLKNLLAMPKRVAANGLAAYRYFALRKLVPPLESTLRAYKCTSEASARQQELGEDP
jgi:hypothetical protein